MAARVKGSPKEGQPDLSRGTASSQLQINTSSIETPGPPTQPPPKEGRLPPTQKDTNIFGVGGVDKDAPNLPPTIGGAFPHIPRSLAKTQTANRQFTREWLHG